MGQLTTEWTPKNSERVWVKVFSNWSLGTYIGFDTIENKHLVREDAEGGGHLMASSQVLPESANPNIPKQLTPVEWFAEALNKWRTKNIGEHSVIGIPSEIFEQAKEMEKEQENKLICEILQIQHLPPHIDESGADGTQGWDGIPDKETEQEDIALKAKEMEEQQKGYSKEEVIQLLIKMNSWPTTFDGEADISEWFEQFKSE